MGRGWGSVGVVVQGFRCRCVCRGSLAGFNCVCTATAPAARSPSAACKRGETRARIAGKSTCLRAGKACLKRLDRQYHRYGFHCQTGRLTRAKPTPPPKAADVRLELRAPDEGGGKFSLDAGLENLGPSTATNVVVRFTLPAGATAAGVSACATPPLCAMGSLEAGAENLASMTVQFPAGGPFEVSATVTSDTRDPNPANNSARITVAPPTPSADLAISIADTPDPVGVNNNITYAATIMNGGPSAADAVRFTDALPASLTLVSAGASQGTCTGTTTIDCAVGSLANAASVAVTIIVRATLAGTATNTVSVASFTSDPNPATNSATATTVVIAPPPPANCAASYPDVCIPPPPPDLHCKDIPYRNFRVIYNVPDPDPHGFDSDRDGIG
jgi:uncharacterized repeat protein (TIGR01451 family)